MVNNLSKISHTFITSVIIALMMLLSSALVSRNFGTSGLAEIGLLLFCSSLVLIFAAIFGGSSIVYVSSKHPIHSIFIVSTVTVFAASIFIGSFIYLLPWVAVSIGWLLIVSLFQAFYTNMLFFLLAKNNTSLYNYIRLLQPILLLIAVVLIISLDFKNIQLYYYALTFSYIIPSIYILMAQRSYLMLGKKFDKNELRATAVTFYRFGGISQLTNGIQLLNYRISLLVIAFFCSQKDVGIMVLALTFVDGIWMYKNSVSLINYMETSQSNKEKRGDNNLLKLVFLSVCVTVVVTISVVLVPDHLYRLIFGKDFTELKQLILYMTPGIIFMAASSPISSYFSGSGKVWVNLVVAVSGILVFLPSLYMTTEQYGLKGAALASNIPHVLGSLLLFYFYFRQTKRFRADITLQTLPINKTTNE